MNTNRTHPKIIDRGWSLLELMIVLVVIAVLASIAYPSYSNHVTKTRRVDGKALLFHAAQREQQFYTRNHSFTATVGTGGLEIASNSVEGYYTLSIVATTTTYTLTATRAASQTADALCGNLTLNHLGARGISGGSLSADDCW